jgi:hypothetical protein
MGIVMLNPTGAVASVERRPERSLETVRGRKVGYVFNQHETGRHFWTALEQEVTRRYSPLATNRAYKVNTWAPTPKAELDSVIAESDYVLVGLGA